MCGTIKRPVSCNLRHAVRCFERVIVVKGAQNRPSCSPNRHHMLVEQDMEIAPRQVQTAALGEAAGHSGAGAAPLQRQLQLCTSTRPAQRVMRSGQPPTHAQCLEKSLKSLYSFKPSIALLPLLWKRCAD